MHRRQPTLDGRRVPMHDFVGVLSFPFEIGAIENMHKHASVVTWSQNSSFIGRTPAI
jgi:hypothetical protein